MNGSSFKGLIGVLVAGSMMAGSTAAVAATTPMPVASASQIAPWAALSAMSGGMTASTLCGSSAAIAGAAGAVAPGGGCVLPQVDAAPPVAQSGPPQPIPIPPVEAPSAFVMDPLMLALGALAAGALLYFLVIKKNNNEPNSPA